MEIPEKLISGLLEIHDCVIIPDFGGLVLNETPAGFSANLNELIPPRKTVSFNRSLNMNDGLLANHVAKELHTTYNDAVAIVFAMAAEWKKKLSNGERLILNGFGSFIQDRDEKILFSPDGDRNYSRTSYGLPSLILTPVEKQSTQKVFALPDRSIDSSQEKNPSIGRSLKAAAIAAVFILGFVIVFKNISEKQLFTSANDPVYQHTEPVAPVINNITAEKTSKPAPVVNTNTISEQTNVAASNTMFYVVGGSFKVEANAKKFVKELQEKGFKAQMLDNEDGWFRVSYLTEQDSLKADKDLHSIKINENQSAWLLKF